MNRSRNMLRKLAFVVTRRSAPAALQSSRRKSLLRWRVGHQLFIVLDQMLLASVAVVDRALAERDWVLAEKSLDRLSQLLFASAAALRHTGDFAPGAYQRMVVPDMVSFYPTPGMSGGNMVDHLLLVKAMRRLASRHGDAIQLAPAFLYDAYLRYEHARAAALDAHRHVCVWSAGNRKSLASRTEEPAGVKIARIDERRRRDVCVGRAVRDIAPNAEVAVAEVRPLNVDIRQAPSHCPMTRLRALFRRLTPPRPR
jgi:hypothetical protein